MPAAEPVAADATGRSLWAPRAWLGGRWYDGVLLRIDARGHWAEIAPDISTPPADAIRLEGPVLPGLGDATATRFSARAGLAERAARRLPARPTTLVVRDRSIACDAITRSMRASPRSCMSNSARRLHAGLRSSLPAARRGRHALRRSATLAGRWPTRLVTPASPSRAAGPLRARGLTVPTAPRPTPLREHTDFAMRQRDAVRAAGFRSSTRRRDPFAARRIGRVNRCADRSAWRRRARSYPRRRADRRGRSLPRREAARPIEWLCREPG